MSRPPWTCRFGIGSFLAACSSDHLMASWDFDSPVRGRGDERRKMKVEMKLPVPDLARQDPSTTNQVGQKLFLSSSQNGP
jgi:hypothetical protein